MISVPCGLTKDGRPVGMQIIARRYREDQAIEAASAYERLASNLFVRPKMDLTVLKPVSEALTTPGVTIKK